MINHEERITFFGETDSRGKKVKFGIKAKDRAKHIYVIGKTGMGKSTLLENMAIQDIQNGEGLAFLDPHGSTAEKLLEYIPEERIQDVLYFAPFDLEYPISFNVMENVDADKRHLVANGLMSVFEKIWEDAWSARMAYILNNTILALLEYPDATLLGINRVLADKDYRKKVVDNVKDPSVKSFWVNEFGKYTDRFAAEATPAIQNKVGQFTSNSLMRNIIGQSKSSFNLREMMDTRKIIIINLSKGRVGEGNANLLGSMLITKIYLAAMSRADVSETVKDTLPNFYLYVDEFQSFANRSFADILSEARKYKLNLTIAHQYIEQMSEEVRAAVFGNVGTMITFRVGAIDAEVFEKEYSPTFVLEDLVNLGFTQIYLKLMIDGVSSTPFSATSLPPIEPIHTSIKEKVIIFSRQHYGKPRSLIEENIKQWHEPVNSLVVSKPKLKTSGGNVIGQSIKKENQIKNKTYISPFSEKLSQKMKVSPNIPPVDTGKEPLPQRFHPKDRFEKKYSKATYEAKRGTIQRTQNTISLNDLKSSGKTIPKQKEFSEKNRLELKNALASVLNDKIKVKEGSEEIKQDKTEKKLESLENQNKKINNPSDLQNIVNKDLSELDKKEKTESKKEIPEDTLRNVLKIDDEDKNL